MLVFRGTCLTFYKKAMPSGLNAPAFGRPTKPLDKSNNISVSLEMGKYDKACIVIEYEMPIGIPITRRRSKMFFD